MFKVFFATTMVMVTKLQWELASLLCYYGLLLLWGFPDISAHAICDHRFPKHHEVSRRIFMYI